MACMCGDPLCPSCGLAQGTLETVCNSGAPMNLPTDWSRLPSVIPGVEMFEIAHQGLRMAASVEFHNGQNWIHVSVSRRSKMPSYDDLKKVKHDFIGDDRAAYQAFPRAAEHVNLHEFCLHLWCPTGRDPFPGQA